VIPQRASYRWHIKGLHEFDFIDSADRVKTPMWVVRVRAVGEWLLLFRTRHNRRCLRECLDYRPILSARL